MARCWTCGTHVSNYRYTCSACESLNEIKHLQKKVKSYGKDLDYIAQIQQEGFKMLNYTLSSGLSEIASAIEWGFGEISWQLQQQTDVLRSIDHTLKTPSETKANEWRLHAEELRRRGVLEESEEFFLKALNEYRLDYRIYVGLTETYLQMGNFDKAKVFLEKSLPHAPKGSEELAAWCADCQTWVWVKSDVCTQCHGSHLSNQYFEPTSIDWRSYSYRLIGHIYACEEDYSHAMDILHTAIDLSPTYEDGHYDYAQYCAQMRNTEACLSSLQKAILANPLYFYLTQNERNFDPFRSEVEKLLSGISKEACQEARDAIAKSENTLKEAYEAVSKARQALIVSRDKAELKSSTMCDEGEAKLKLARDKVASGDYIAFLEAEPIAEECYTIANNALNTANGEREHFQKRRAEKVNNAWRKVPSMILEKTALGGIIGAIGGCTVGIFLNSTSKLAGSGFLLGAFAGLIIGIYISINITKEGLE